MSTNIEVLRELDELVEAARLLGVTQAKRGFGCYTYEDSRFERAMYESIDKRRAALLAAVDGPDTQAAEIERLRAEVERLKSENARIREALQAIVDEVSDGLVPYSSDSYLPAHLVEQARAVLPKENSND